MSVLVYIENWEGKFKNISFELLSYASKIAEDQNSSVIALSIGNIADDELSKLANYGAEKILNVQDSRFDSNDNKALAKAISGAAKESVSNIIVFANNNLGKAIAPRVSARLKAGLVSAVIEVPESYDPFIVKKKAFSGKTITKIKVNSDIKVLSLSTNAYGIKENAKEVNIESFSPAVDDSDFSIIVEDTQKQTGEILLTEADIVISAGRGMKSADNWKGVEEIAALLGAATACSRPVSDEGWRPHKEHVGQTGKVIAPNLYFAFGISGAIQHLAGISSSKVIVAVNKDAEAPIFSAADYGIVGDVNIVIPQFIEAIKKLKA